MHACEYTPRTHLMKGKRGGHLLVSTYTRMHDASMQIYTQREKGCILARAYPLIAASRGTDSLLQHRLHAATDYALAADHPLATESVATQKPGMVRLADSFHGYCTDAVVALLWVFIVIPYC